MSRQPLNARPQRGDETALFAEFAPLLRRIIARDVNAPPQLIEDACANAWERLLRCQPRRPVYSWLVVTARHEAWRLAARERRAAEPPAELVAPDVARLAHARLELAEVAAALRPRERRLLGLQAAGHSYAEIAALTGDTPRTVDRQLRRARERLRLAA